MTDNNNDRAEMNRCNALKLTGIAGLLATGMASANVMPDGAKEVTKDLVIQGDEKTTENVTLEHEIFYGGGDVDYYCHDSGLELYSAAPLGDGAERDWQQRFRMSRGCSARRYNPDNEEPKDGEYIDVINEHGISKVVVGSGDFIVDYSSGPDDPAYIGGYPVNSATTMEFVESVIENLPEENLMTCESPGDCVRHLTSQEPVLCSIMIVPRRGGESRLQ